MQRIAGEILSSLGPGSPQVFCSQREGRTESLTALLNRPGSLLKCWCSGPAPDFSSEGPTQRVLRISTCKRRCLGTQESEVLGAGTEEDSALGGAAGRSCLGENLTLFSNKLATILPRQIIKGNLES